MMIPHDEVVAAAESIALKFLDGRNYKIVSREERIGGYILLENKKANVLVRVKAALQPDEPGEFTEIEKAELISKARSQDAIPWPAYVQLDTRLRPARKVKWDRL